MDGSQGSAFDPAEAEQAPCDEPPIPFLKLPHSLTEDLPELFDNQLHAMIARIFGGVSPLTLPGALADWWIHWVFAPGRQTRVALKAIDKWQRLANYALRQTSGEKDETQDCVEPLIQDKRFSHEAWQMPPFNVLHQAFLLNQQLWHNATTGLEGMTPANERLVDFAVRQWLDMTSPGNCFWTNPEILSATAAESGENLVRGSLYAADDWWRAVADRPPAGTEAFKVGETLATTPGKVVFRNRLFELIQYTPTTKTVFREPVLITPAWIMKYYILDLSADNSLVKYLVDQGHTVFIMSWRNPTKPDRDLGMDDYLERGVLKALDVVREACPDTQVHLAGYCLGGTLASIAAADISLEEKDCLASLTLLAAQIDFEKPGELALFINPSQLRILDDLMREQGYLDKQQMGGAFQVLRSNDLIWSNIQRQYWLGERPRQIDLMAWNADGTRMPARMHSEYLHQLYLENRFAEGHYTVGGRAVTPTDIRAPIFAVGTEQDHVAPWHSVYKVHLLTDTDVSFVLTSGGHNAGIVSEPGHKHRHFRFATTGGLRPYRAPEAWLADTEEQEGSWWPKWQEWLAARSTKGAKPPAAHWHGEDKSGGAKGDAKLIDAPGTYVHQR